MKGTHFQNLIKSVISNRLGLAILLLTWVTFFSRTLSGKLVYFLDDLKIIYYPIEFAYAIAQNNWELPVWSNVFGFGHPILSWAQLGFFTPLHVILRFSQIHPITLLQISIITYFGIGLIGAFILLRNWRIHQLAASLGAIVFTFSGFHVGHLNHVNFYTTTMLLPLLILAVDKFIHQPTLKKSVIVSFTGAVMALSGQPQVVLYSSIIAIIYALIVLAEQVRSTRHSSKRLLVKLLLLSLLTVFLGLSLSSFATLPLFEFLPHTERAAGIPPETLYEFSYPPWNTITLISPYFFGGHDNYWGPKGYQELAAFTGIIPLLLAGAALSSWKNHKLQKVLSGTLITICIAMALGKFSPIYFYLVEHHIITSLSIPGRFVFFFTTAIALLSALGLNDIIRRSANSKNQIIGGTIFSLALILPFLIHVPQDERIADQFKLLLSAQNPEVYLFVIGIILFIALTRKHSKHTPAAITIFTALTLLSFGWNFNPLTASNIAYSTSPLASELTSYHQENRTTPRLYSRDSILRASDHSGERIKTNPISPQLSILQPITVRRNDLKCIKLPLWFSQESTGNLNLAIHEKISGPILSSTTIDTTDISSFNHQWCFDNISPQQNDQLILSITSQDNIDLGVFIEPTTQEDQYAYIIRVENPTVDQVINSAKPLRVPIQQVFKTTSDPEAAVIARHLNATLNTSSARWIGALSIRSYREFIEQFFANDREPFDGEGRHAIISNRKILNMSGVTHLSQETQDTADPAMISQGFTPITSSNIGRSNAIIYRNPDAFPKVFMVPEATYLPANDEARHAMGLASFDPTKSAFIKGPTPPELPLEESTSKYSGKAEIIEYLSNKVVINTDSNKESVLILNDTSLPQWQTTIDNVPAPQYVANTIFRAAIVPAGKHQVVFTYHSPAIQRAQTLTLIGLFTSLLALAAHYLLLTRNSNLET